MSDSASPPPTISPELVETVWIGKGFLPEPATLRLRATRLILELNGSIAIDDELRSLSISWPWYGFGCQFIARAGGREYFVSFLHTNNTIGSWARGIRNGRRWYRIIKARQNRLP